MQKKVGKIPFDKLVDLLDEEFITYPRISDIGASNKKTKSRLKVDLKQKNNGRNCGIYQVGGKYVVSVYAYEKNTVFVEISDIMANNLLHN